MDFKDPKTQKWLLGALAAVAVVYFWHSKIYSGYEQKITSEYARYEMLQTELKSVEMKCRTIDALKSEYNDLTGRYRTIAMLLPEDDQIASLLAKVHSAALETSSRVASVEPQAAVSEGFYDRHDYQLTVHSTYHDFGDFLARISNLPFIVNVGSVHMVTVSEQDNPQTAHGDFTMTATLTISTYQVKESERLVIAGL